MKAIAEATMPSDQQWSEASGRPPTLLLIDNYDSYTYNIAQMLAAICHGRMPLIIRNDEYPDWPSLVAAMPPFDAVVVSPGPGHPACATDFGLCAYAYSCGLPVLGVCLGHQGLALAFGATVQRAPEVMHGRLSAIAHDGTGLFDGLASPLDVVRYHSLLVDMATLPCCLRVTASTADGLIMALQHKDKPLYGLQFHPESICTQNGASMLANFIRICAARKLATRPDEPVGLRPMVSVPLQKPLCSPEKPLSQADTKHPRELNGADRWLLVHEVDLPRTIMPEEAFTALFGSAPTSFWLDAADGSRTRFSYLGCGNGPHSSIVYQHPSGVHRVYVANDEGGINHGRAPAELRREIFADQHIEAVMREALFEWGDPLPKRCSVPNEGMAVVLSEDHEQVLPPDMLFRGGFVGYLGYEMLHTMCSALHCTRQGSACHRRAVHAIPSLSTLSAVAEQV